MTRDINAVKMNQVRTTILGNLNRMYPTPLQVRTLYRVMIAFDENYSLSLMEKDITYLKQKGYVEYIDEILGGGDSFKNKVLALTAESKVLALTAESKVLALTAESKEIADRTQTDDALEICTTDGIPRRREGALR